MTWINVLLDLECHLGSTSKIAKLLKDMGFSPRIIAYNLIRLRYKERLDHNMYQHVSSKINNLLALIGRQVDDWSTMCIEVWVEKPTSKHHDSRLIKHGDTCIYMRKGPHGRTIVKLVWIDQCVESRTPMIPESITRLCIESSDIMKRGISSIGDKIAHFYPLVENVLDRFDEAR